MALTEYQLTTGLRYKRDLLSAGIPIEKIRYLLTECQLPFKRLLYNKLLVVKKKPVVREKETYCLEKRPIVWKRDLLWL
jgi:hypothetical protein